MITLTLPMIMKVTSQVTGINYEEIASKTRKRAVAKARQLFCYLARRETNLSLLEIGSVLSNRDHSTVLHNINVYQDQLDVAKILKSNKIKEIEYLAQANNLIDEIKRHIDHDLEALNNDRVNRLYQDLGFEGLGKMWLFTEVLHSTCIGEEFNLSIMKYMHSKILQIGIIITWQDFEVFLNRLIYFYEIFYLDKGKYLKSIWMVK